MITLSGLRTARIKNIDGLIAQLSLHYTPAIQDGRQILFQAAKNKPEITVPEFRFPEMQEQVTADIEVNGKSARITMGLVPDGHVLRHRGIVISYGYRVIKEGDEIGTGGQPTPGLFGWLSLGREWELTKNKNDLADGADKQALSELIYERCREVIQKAAKRGMSIPLRNVSKMLTEALKALESDGPGGAAKLKAKRNSPENESGAVDAKNTGRRHSKARRVQPGNTFGVDRLLARGLQVTWESGGAKGPAFRVTGSRIYLNSDIGAINSDVHEESRAARHAVYAYATWAVLHGEDRKLFDTRTEAEIDSEMERVSKLAGKLLAQLDETKVAPESPAPMREANGVKFDPVLN